MTQPNLSLTTPIMIKVSNLAKSYDGVNFALAAISFEADLIHRLIFIDGPNGCGKTTLLKILTGEEYPSEGSFCLKDHEQLTLIYQRDGLLPEITALENLRMIGSKDTESTEMAERLGLSVSVLRRKAKYLSGGEERRVQLARTLVSKRHFWILDEPTSHADKSLRLLMSKAIVENIARGGTAIIVTHDTELRKMLIEDVSGICEVLTVEITSK